MKNKIFAIGFILTISAFVMIGCGDKKKEETTTSVETTGSSVDAVGDVGDEGETTSSIYINYGDGDNAGIDIFTDAAQVNKEDDEKQTTKNKNNKDNKDNEDDKTSVSETKKDNSNNEVEETTKKEGSNKKDPADSANNDDGWTGFY